MLEPPNEWSDCSICVNVPPDAYAVNVVELAPIN